ncbi:MULTISPECIES: TetR/AcrR family transcriptional regulator [unclassified Brevibacterium]|uniref:TetR/AcrR family transcriptional regulator n=1 Tax=unclassified Brevibacterium TaxID=2614124 RepID=UPI001091BFAD|nr:TetR/AcrR family transcriptional regulator [Brevibacterium sp. S22]TGD33287.1 TetR/AcrR family transcriptional regulator [Brevibacterium sp. S22]
MPRPRIPERRNRLLAAARQLALEQGWPATTVAEVAARADVGKGAVYLEFDSKAAILDALITDGMQTLSSAVHRRVREADEVVDLPAIYRFAVDALLDDKLMRAFYLGDQDVLGDHVRSVPDNRYRQRFDWLTDYITRLKHAGVIDPRSDLQAVALMFSVFTIGLLHTPGTLEAITDDELRRTVGLFAELVGEGLASDRPVDSAAARQAQLAMMGSLQTQLAHLHPEQSGAQS